MSKYIYIGVGSNLNPEQNIIRALDLLSEKCEITAISNFYSSKSFGNTEQDDFINGVLRIMTDFSPEILKFNYLRKIESKLGRIRSVDKNKSREIDLDILIYKYVKINTFDYDIPDKSIKIYPFIYIPLLELESKLKLPFEFVFLKDEVKLKRKSELTLLNDFTNQLNKRYFL